MSAALAAWEADAPLYQCYDVGKRSTIVAKQNEKLLLLSICLSATCFAKWKVDMQSVVVDMLGTLDRVLG